MKCIGKILSLLLLSLAASCPTADSSNDGESDKLDKVLDKVTEVITLGIDFLKQIANLTSQNEERYLVIRDAMEELNLDIANSNLTDHEADIVRALNLASDNYLIMNRLLRELCVQNTETFSEMDSPDKLDVKSSKFRGEATFYLTEEAYDLTSMVEVTLEKKEAAYKYIEEVRNKISSVSGTLTFTRESFKKLEAAKKSGLTTEIKKAKEELSQSCEWYQLICNWNKGDKNKAATMTVSINEAQLTQIGKFMDDTMDYINWLKDSGSKLKNATEADENILTELAGRAGHGKTLLGKLEKIYFPFFSDKSEDDIKRFAEKLYRAAKKISNTCDRFLNGPNHNQKRSIIEHQNFEQDQLRDCALESIKQMTGKQIYSKTNSKIKSSLPFFGARTLEKLVALSTFFEVSLKKINTIIVNVQTNAVDFLNRQKIIHDTVADLTGQQHNAGNYNDLMAQITHLDSYWDDNLSKLQGLKDEWDSLLNATNGSKPEDVINYEADNKIKEIIFLLDSFKLGMVQKVPYGDGKTTDLSTFASSALAYLGEVLQDNFTIPASSKVIEDGSLRVQNKTVSKNKNIPIACSLKREEDYYKDMVSRKFSEVQKSFQSLSDVRTKHKLFALTVFHDHSLKSVGQFGSLLKISIDHFLFELKKLDKVLKISTLKEINNGEFAEINNYLEQLTAIWGNVMSNLKIHSYHWKRFLSKIQDIDETTIRKTVDSKVTAVRTLLNDQKLTKVSRVSEKILIWDILTYLEKILITKF